MLSLIQHLISPTAGGSLFCALFEMHKKAQLRIESPVQTKLQHSYRLMQAGYTFS